MNVLVAGGTGFVGTALCEELAERGHDVVALARSPGTASFDPDYADDIRTVAGDVTAFDSIRPHVEGVDCVVNLVALSPLFKPSGGYERHFDVHLGGTENLVRAAQEAGVRKFVQQSGLDASTGSDTAYLRSKGEAEAVVRESGLDWTIFRPSVIFGEGDEFVGFTKMLAPPYLSPLPGGGETPFQPIWVEDFVAMMADAVEGRAPDEAADADETAEDADEEDADAEEPVEDADEADPHVGQTYEIGGPEVLTMAEVARLAHAADNKPVRVIDVPMPLAGIGLSLLDYVPGSPFGGDQYRSLRVDNTVEHNDIDAFGVSEDDLTTLQEYLGVTDERLRELDRHQGEAV